MYTKNNYNKCTKKWLNYHLQIFTRLLRWLEVKAGELCLCFGNIALCSLMLTYSWTTKDKAQPRVLAFRLHEADIFIFSSLCSDFKAAEIPAPVYCCRLQQIFFHHQLTV
jgi:hypothetical protein